MNFHNLGVSPFCNAYVALNYVVLIVDSTIDEIMTLLKTVKHKPSLTPYEQFFIQAHHQQNKLIAEQNPGKHNPIIQLALDTTYTSCD
jgi:hypothetical protein